MELAEQATFETERMTEIEADELLEEIQSLTNVIKSAEDERDTFIAHYENKIFAAKDICDKKTKEAREKIACLTDNLRRYAETQITDKKRSVPLPTGTLQFRKQSPRFFFDDLEEANATNERLINFVKHNAYKFLKVKTEESVDWEHFKRQLSIDEDGVVSFAETGETIDGLHAQVMPDKFTVKMRTP